jgi:PAS domain S-box-containing protein
MSVAITNSLHELGFEVAEHTNAMLAYWDKNLICKFANRAYIDWFGVTPEEMINKMRLQDLLGTLFNRNLPYITEALAGKVQVFEREIRTPSGEIRHSMATYCPDFENGKVEGFYVHVVDITAVKNKSAAEATGIENQNYLSLSNDPVSNVVTALKSSLLTGFPGIKRLSRQYYISESTLKRDFKKQFNTTIFSFYRNLQMDLAEKYINGKKCTKAQMAVMLNFSNPSNFSLCYRKYLKEKTTKELIEKLKKSNDEKYKTFIAQSPFAIAMLDNNMRYLAASRKWMADYDLLGKNVTDENFYDIHPDTKPRWKEIHKACLNGAISVGEEEFIEKPDGSPGWLKWDMRPWYIEEKEIGGILIFTEDITTLKLKDSENRKISEILEKTNELARIGAWKRNFRTNTAIWSKITREILEVPEDFIPDIETGLSFYKKGQSRDLIKKVLKDAMECGKSFDVEVEIVTQKGNLKKVRVIGYPEFYNGKCERLMGIFQDITHYNR